MLLMFVLTPVDFFCRSCGCADHQQLPVDDSDAHGEVVAVAVRKSIQVRCVLVHQRFEHEDWQ